MVCKLHLSRTFDIMEQPNGTAKECKIMRMRKKAWARPELEQCPYFIQDPRSLKGRWNKWFPKEQPLHLELGCGKCVFTAELAAQHPEIFS